MDNKRVDSNKVWTVGVVDVGPVVLSHCENPAKDEAIDFMTRVLTGAIGAVIPLTSFLGAYHIMTHYLRVNRYAAAKEILRTLRLRSPKFLEDISLEVCLLAMKFAPNYDLGCWGGYIVALAHRIGASTIYTTDQKLAKVKDLKIVVPISQSTLTAFHDWLEKKLQNT